MWEIYIISGGGEKKVKNSGVTRLGNLRKTRSGQHNLVREQRNQYKKIIRREKKKTRRK